jgi:LysM repeat protein
MKKRTSFTARIFAALALAAAIVAVVILVPKALNERSSSDGSKKGSNHPSQQEPIHHRTKAKTYEVESGDTLLSIAHKTGVTVAEIQALNPEVDPQILTVGEILKLKE